jgi:hypothetical protein
VSSGTAGAQQGDSALGGFEAILDQFIALISASQAGEGDPDGQGDPSTAQQSSGDAADSSQDSKQVGDQLSQIPNKNPLIPNAADALAAAATRDHAAESGSADIIDSGSVSHTGAKKKEDSASEKSSQSDGSSFGTIDSFMIAAAAAAGLQVPIVPVSVTSSAVDSSALAGIGSSGRFDASSATSAMSVTSSTVDPQGALTDIKNLSASKADRSGTAKSEKKSADLSAKDSGETPSSETSQNSDRTSFLTSTTSTTQSQPGSNNAVIREQMKKAAEQAQAIASSTREQSASPAASSGPPSAASGQAVAGAGILSNQTAAVSDPTTQMASMTWQELSATRQTNAKKPNESATPKQVSEVTNFTSAARAEFQPVITGSNEKAMASGSGLQGGTNPFGVLDSAPTTSEQQAQLLRASHRQVEVGVQDPQYGWVEVKTQMSAGQVVASLSVNSVAAQHALQQELPAMHHFVASRDLDLSSLSVSTGTENGAGSFHQDSGQGTGNQNQSYNQISSGEVWGGQPSSSVSSTATTENVWMPETASRISVLA